MTRHVALLRAVNVGTGRKVPMADLRTLLADAGAGDVETYIQSGNAVLSHPARAETELRADLEVRLEAAFGFAIPVILRRADAWETIVTGNPFRDADPAHLHVSFLRDAPPAGALDALDAERFAPEAFAADGREVYLHLPAGMGRAKLPRAVARAHGVPETTRNWRTILRLLDMAQSRG